jgi:hypothetical protein
MRSEVSESSQSELSEALNTSALNTNSQAAAADLPSASLAPELVQVEGKSYLLIDRLANQRAGVKVSWIWDYGRELRLLAGVTPRKC